MRVFYRKAIQFLYIQLLAATVRKVWTFPPCLQCSCKPEDGHVSSHVRAASERHYSIRELTWEGFLLPFSCAIFSSAIFLFEGFQRASADLTERRLFKQKTTSTTHQDWGFPCSFWEGTGISQGLWRHLTSLLVTRPMRTVGVPTPLIAKRVDDVITYNRSSAFLWCCKLEILAKAESNWASSELIIFTILAISP